jgi:hypothetical protein
MAGQGMLYTWGDTVTPKRTIANLITIIDPQDTPCVSYFGLDNWDRFNIVDYPNGKYEWLQDTLRVRTAQVNEIVADNTDTTIVLKAGEGALFKAGDVLRLEPVAGNAGELVRVVSIATDTLTVVREYGGTTNNTALAVDDTVRYVFSARDEGMESDRTPYTVPTNPYNQSQILHAEIMLSGSERNATNRYGIPDSYLYQLQKWLGGAGAGAGTMGRAGDLMIDLEETFFNGRRVMRTDAANNDGMMGGANYWIQSNRIDASAADVSEELIVDAVEACWDRGGRPNTIIANAHNKRTISAIWKDIVRTERSERTGGVIIDTVETEFGMLDIMLNRWCQKDKVYVLEREKMGWVTLRPWFVEPLAKGGDYTKDEIVGEYGFVLQHEEAHAIIENTSIT